MSFLQQTLPMVGEQHIQEDLTDVDDLDFDMNTQPVFDEQSALTSRNRSCSFTDEPNQDLEKLLTSTNESATSHEEDETRATAYVEEKLLEPLTLLGDIPLQDNKTNSATVAETLSPQIVPTGSLLFSASTVSEPSSEDATAEATTASANGTAPVKPTKKPWNTMKPLPPMPSDFSKCHFLTPLEREEKRVAEKKMRIAEAKREAKEFRALMRERAYKMIHSQQSPRIQQINLERAARGESPLLSAFLKEDDEYDDDDDDDC